MFGEASKMRFQGRTLNINEDLGQIKYVFSDKTGTLTENKTEEFRCSSVGALDYSAASEDEECGGRDHRPLLPSPHLESYLTNYTPILSLPWPHHTPSSVTSLSLLYH
ncbi:hypothetical protein B296_00006969 [Ensete ventricosum]|uniref:P-type ATPase N-terminal domain-containing protein n=1 Tax=Ensete ventricosum TaxID=4639 RepID=A0A427ADE9_ENSVE|nr:hypothetical protein B296_00006969 [Ensete ventricosum]